MKPHTIRDMLPLPKPDRRTDATGYVNAGGCREHVMIAVLALYRLDSSITGLPKGWEVHHINRKRNDNRPVNLVVCETKRLHHLLHTIPDMLDNCVWLGEPEKSVRIFRAFEPDGTYFCVRCRKVKPLTEFQKSKRYVSGVKSECADCRNTKSRLSNREWRRTHPPLPYRATPQPGVKNPAVKLTEEQVLRIRAEHAAGTSQTCLAKQFNVSQSTISLIVLRKHWNHI